MEAGVLKHDDPEEVAVLLLWPATVSLITFPKVQRLSKVTSKPDMTMGMSASFRTRDPKIFPSDVNTVNLHQ